MSRNPTTPTDGRTAPATRTPGVTPWSTVHLAGPRDDVGPRPTGARRSCNVHVLVDGRSRADRSSTADHDRADDRRRIHRIADRYEPARRD